MLIQHVDSQSLCVCVCVCNAGGKKRKDGKFWVVPRNMFSTRLVGKFHSNDV